MNVELATEASYCFLECTMFYGQVAVSECILLVLFCLNREGPLELCDDYLPQQLVLSVWRWFRLLNQGKL